MLIPRAERRALFAQAGRRGQRRRRRIWAAEVREDCRGSARRASALRRAPGLVAALVRRLGPERLRSVLAGMKVRGMSVYRGLPGPGRTRHASFGRGGRPAAPGTGRRRQPPRRRCSGPATAWSRTSASSWVSRAPAPSGHAVLISGRGGPSGRGVLDGGRRVRLGAARSARCSSTRSAPSVTSCASTPSRRRPSCRSSIRRAGWRRRTPIGPRPTSSPIPERALETLAREELGLDPGRARLADAARPRRRSPRSRSAPRFRSAPFLARRGSRGRSARRWSLTAAALFGVGCAISLFTGRGALAQRRPDAAHRRRGGRGDLRDRPAGGQRWLGSAADRA